MLDQHGALLKIRPTQISNLLGPRRSTVATDRNGSEIRFGDKVREIGGEQKQGEIMHIFRSYLFLHNSAQADNSGISVVRANNVATISARGGRGGRNGIDTSRMNPAIQRNGANGHANSMAPPNASDRWNRALGQRCMIRRGPYKGLLGFLVEHRDQVAYLEQDGSTRKLEIWKDDLKFAEYAQTAFHEVA